ncbi:MAG: Crp/Fnr family transcriptional regulator [Eubacteriales bacterium]|nr:Crp/Fnr family transcriptional regulator [Eubacteriales bacterium]
MDFTEALPVWKRLDEYSKNKLAASVLNRKAAKGTVVHSGSIECTGLIIVKSGLLRAYIISPDGREISIYRLFERDMCLLSASCIMKSLSFEIIIEAEKDTEYWLIPANIYKEVMEESAPLANYTNEIMATRFSDVMSLLEQIMWKSMDKRLAAFLYEESAIEESNILKVTHENIANHLGTAREVITRMLKYFQSEGLVKLSRGTIEILDLEKLEKLAKEE